MLLRDSVPRICFVFTHLLRLRQRALRFTVPSIHCSELIPCLLDL